MTATLLDAITLAVRAHAGQADKAGEPYIGHVARVACRARMALRGRGVGSRHVDAELQAELDRIEQVAWLHDVVEDTAADARALYASGFAADVVGAVSLLTKPAGRDYAGQVAAIAASGDLAAIVVKLADIADNLDPARARALTPSHRRRYEEARRTLEAAFRAMGP